MAPEHGAATDRFAVETICAELIRIDTSNPGPGERVAAEYVAGCLDRMGVAARVVESAPRRSSVVARVAGTDRDAPALLVQGHLDTVPAAAAEWTHDPWGGEIADGFVWGRGAVDMKNALAMTLACVGRMWEQGRAPARDLVLAFTADEEAGGNLGARYLIEEHRELFDGCAAAIGEVGGINLPADAAGRHTFVISTADKGIRRYSVRCRGVAGHGSLPALDNPIESLARVLVSLSSDPLPLRVTDSMRALATALLARDAAGDDQVVDVLEHTTGPMGRFLGAALRNTLNITMLDAGPSPNTVPAEASALVDARFVPGHESDFDAFLAGPAFASAEIELTRHTPAVVSPDGGVWFERLAAALRAVEPDASVAPFVFSGATDGKWFTRLGIPTYGFTPMLVPGDFDYPAMFHGVDERVPVTSLRFGVDVLDRLFAR